MMPILRNADKSAPTASFRNAALRAVLLAGVAFAAAGCAGDNFWEPSAKTTAGEANSPAETLLRVARGTRDNGDFASAVTIYKRVHDLDGKRADVLVELGQVLSALGAHNEAAETFRKAVKLAPNNVDALRGLGNNLLAMDQAPLALEQFVAALALQEDPRLYNGMGVVHDMNGSHDSAQSSYKSGLALAPNDFSLRSNMALSLALAGKFDEATQILGRMIKEPGSTVRHRQNLALIYGLGGKFAEAASIARLDLDEPAVQGNLAYYETLRSLPAKDRAAAVFGITVLAPRSDLSHTAVQPSGPRSPSGTKPVPASAAALN